MARCVWCKFWHCVILPLSYFDIVCHFAKVSCAKFNIVCHFDNLLSCHFVNLSCVKYCQFDWCKFCQEQPIKCFKDFIEIKTTESFMALVPGCSNVRFWPGVVFLASVGPKCRGRFGAGRNVARAPETTFGSIRGCKNIRTNYYLASGCSGSVGREVVSCSRGPRFEFSHRQTFILNIYVLPTVLKRLK